MLHSCVTTQIVQSSIPMKAYFDFKKLLRYQVQMERKKTAMATIDYRISLTYIYLQLLDKRKQQDI